MLHTFMTTRPFKLHFADTEQYFLRPPGLLSVTSFDHTSPLQTSCYLSTDSRPTTVAGQVRDGRVCPRRQSCGGLRLHPSGDCIPIPLAARQRSVFWSLYAKTSVCDVLPLIRMASSRSTSKVGLRLSPLPLLTSMRKCGPSITSSSLARRVRVQPLLLSLLLFVR